MSKAGDILGRMNEGQEEEEFSAEVHKRQSTKLTRHQLLCRLAYLSFENAGGWSRRDILSMFMEGITGFKEMTDEELLSEYSEMVADDPDDPSGKEFEPDEGWGPVENEFSSWAE